MVNLQRCDCCGLVGATWRTTFGLSCGRCLSHDVRAGRLCIARLPREQRHWEQERAGGPFPGEAGAQR